MSLFDVFPAIDLRAGMVVRLVQGDPRRQTQYSTDPAATASRWAAAGVNWLHVVNLDGALDEADKKNWAALQAILETMQANNPQVKVQFGGGMRRIDDIEKAFSVGVSRVVLGTTAIESPQVVSAALSSFGSQGIAVALDFSGNKLKLHGWQHESDLTPLTLGKTLAGIGVRTLICTDISRDGIGAGVNVTASRSIAQGTGLSVIASGGVTSLEDVRQVRQAGLRGVIIGKALYQGTIDLMEALAC